MNDSEKSSSPSESRFEQWLAKSVYRADCLDSIKLGEYEIGLLSSADAAVVDVHLKKCPKCRHELDVLRTFMMGDDVFETVKKQSADVVDRLQRPFRRLIAKLQTHLSGSTIEGQAMVGILRGAIGDQLVYVVDDIQIVIDIQIDVSQPDRKSILGLVLGIDETQALSAQLWLDGIEVATTTVDEFGNFLFQALSSGDYQLLLSSSTDEIIFEQVSL